jgi:hypothetical protein
MATKRTIRGHLWTFLGNYDSKAKADKSAEGHKKNWGGRTTIETVKVGYMPNGKQYLLYWRKGK